MTIKSISIHFICLLSSFVISAQINFIEDMSQSFEGAAIGSLDFADIDNDGDQDFLTTGLNADLDTLTILYKNDGLGNFTKVTNTPFENVFNGDAAFGDIDNDGDKDLIITGTCTTGIPSTMLFNNDGAGNFTEIENTSFEPLSAGKLAFADLDNDGDKDLILLGTRWGQGGGIVLLISKIYFNDSQGNFLPSVNDDLSTYGPFDMADIDGDKDLDILISGNSISGSQGTTTLYLNDGSGEFTEMLNTPFLGVIRATVNFADIDGDTDMDVLITGLTGSIWPNTKMYINDGEGNFIEAPDSQISVFSGACGFADIDLDQDLEMFITGDVFGFIGPIAMLYTNDGNGTFSEVSNLPFVGAKRGFIEFVDVDGDEDLDLFITGFDSTNTSRARLYLNDFTVSSTESSLAFSLKVFPNPFDEYFKLDFENTNGKSIIELTNILGQIVLTKQIVSFNEIEISTAHLQGGLYFLTVNNEKGRSEIISLYKN